MLIPALQGYNLAWVSGDKYLHLWAPGGVNTAAAEAVVLCWLGLWRPLCGSAYLQFEKVATLGDAPICDACLEKLEKNSE